VPVSALSLSKLVDASQPLPPPNSFQRNIYQNKASRKLSNVFTGIPKSYLAFFPSILFLVLALFATWYLTQGKDIMQRTLEQPRIFYMFVVATIFWVYITWYTSRIIGKVTYASLSRKPGKEERFWGRFLIQMPRFLSFSCLTVIILALSSLKKILTINTTAFSFLGLLFSSFYYFRTLQVLVQPGRCSG
jgi:hypothetical protein